MFSEDLPDARWDEQRGSGDGVEGGRELFGKLSLLAFVQSLEVSLLKWTHSPASSPAEDGTLSCAFPTPVLPATNACAHGGSSPLPGVLCVEPAGRASEGYVGLERGSMQLFLPFFIIF